MFSVILLIFLGFKQFLLWPSLSLRYEHVVPFYILHRIWTLHMVSLKECSNVHTSSFVVPPFFSLEVSTCPNLAKFFMHLLGKFSCTWFSISSPIHEVNTVIFLLSFRGIFDFWWWEYLHFLISCLFILRQGLTM